MRFPSHQVPKKVITRTLFGYGLHEFHHFERGGYPVYIFRGLVAREDEAAMWLHIDVEGKEIILWQRNEEDEN